MLLFLTSMMLLIHGTLEALTVVPENKAVSPGYETVVLGCHSSLGYNISWYASGKEVWNSYYLRPDVRTYLSVERVTKGTCNLKISHSDDAAQTYMCKEPGTLTEASAEVIWIESDLNCTDSSTEDFVNLTCSIEFRGNWAPTMEWKEHSNDGDKVLSVGINTTTIRNQHVTSKLVMKVQDGRSYSCTTKFYISGKPNTTTATNVPDTILVWTSLVFPETRDKLASNSDVITGTTAAIIIISVIVIAALIGTICFIHAKRRRGAKRNGQHELIVRYQERKAFENPKRQDENGCQRSSPEESPSVAVPLNGNNSIC